MTAIYGIQAIFRRGQTDSGSQAQCSSEPHFKIGCIGSDKSGIDANIRPLAGFPMMLKYRPKTRLLGPKKFYEKQAPLADACLDSYGFGKGYFRTNSLVRIAISKI